MEFLVRVLRFHFMAVDLIRFPSGKGGNVVRGAFGHALRRVAASQDYEKMFEPKVAGGPSGLHERPRPFVIRASHLDGRTIAPGDRFHFDMHVFLRDGSQILVEVERAFQQAGVDGFGASRGSAVLENVGSELMTLPLCAGPEPVHRMAVRFETPTELKQAGAVAERPDFAVLFARARDRVSTIAKEYGGVTLELDYRGMGARAAAVETRHSLLRWVDVERRSSRTGQRHEIGGFLGEVEYEGELTEFIPILKAAEWTGVGRQTVWGKGAIRILLQ